MLGDLSSQDDTYRTTVHGIDLLESKRVSAFVSIFDLSNEIRGIQEQILHAAGEILLHHYSLLNVWHSANVKLLIKNALV